MSQRGGARKGAGRPRGSRNVKTREIAKAATQSGLSPLDYMLKIMRDKKCETDRRDKMAVACAPFIHPRLAVTQIDMTAEVVAQTRAEIDGMLIAAGIDPEGLFAKLH